MELEATDQCGNIIFLLSLQSACHEIEVESDLNTNNIK